MGSGHHLGGNVEVASCPRLQPERWSIPQGDGAWGKWQREGKVPLDSEPDLGIPPCLPACPACFFHGRSPGKAVWLEWEVRRREGQGEGA